MDVAVDGVHGNGGLRQWWSSSTEAAVGWRGDDAMASLAMASLADGGGGNGGRCLWLMVAAGMAVVMVNCSSAVDAAATIPSLALTAAAKMPLPLPPSTAASIDNKCYCRH
jgi:hypothetical protein